ncbi:MAG: OmpH family outer membrane protein [Candidatus Paracaedibacteraceae bacterium]|nr:OmpH family outer membrane protein [Candidatus Paracaedibacteraceae bacterium]
MKNAKNLVIGACIAACVGFLGFALGVNRFLIPSGELKIAVVDGDRLKKEAAPFQVVRQLLLAEQTKAHEEILPIETELVKEQQEIRLQAKKHPEAAKKRREEFDKKVVELEQRTQKIRTKLDKQANELSGTIQETVFLIINEIAKKEKVNLVLNMTIDDKRAVFFVENRMDLTDTVISETNKRLKNIKLPTISE